MRTGEFKHRIKLITNNPTQDPNTGDMISAETQVAEIWAKVTPMTGSRALSAGQVLNGKPYEIRVRYRADLNEDMIIDWAGKRITIHSVVNLDADGKMLLITGAEVK